MIELCPLHLYLPAVDSRDRSRAICAGAGLFSASQPPFMTCKLFRDDGVADAILFCFLARTGYNL